MRAAAGKHTSYNYLTTIELAEELRCDRCARGQQAGARLQLGLHWEARKAAVAGRAVLGSNFGCFARGHEVGAAAGYERGTLGLGGDNARRK